LRDSECFEKFQSIEASRMKNQVLFAHINLVKGERGYLAELASDLL